MLNRNRPLSLGSAFATGLPLASQKSAYTATYYHGANLEDAEASGIIIDFDSANDHFAEQNFLIRMPRVVRFLIGTTGIPIFTHYADIAAALAVEYPSICFTWGTYTPQLSMRFLLNCTPGLGLVPAADLEAGDVLTFHLPFRHLNYDFHDSVTAPNAEYTSDLSDFAERHPRHTSFRGHYWNIFHTADGFDDEDVINNAMAGAGPFAALGPGLAEYGWSVEHIKWNDTPTLVQADDFRAKIDDFFDL
jgi:hypothetical protein